jgi:HEAT repeat protein
MPMTEDNRSVVELFAAAIDRPLDDGEFVNADDYKADWKAVIALQMLGTQEVLDGALGLLKSSDPLIRARGLDILGQLGSPVRSFPEECLNAALQSIAEDDDPDVLQAAAAVLGHLGDVRGVTPLVGLAGHPDLDIRFTVALALGGRLEPEAVAALIRLTEDEDSDVRDWATFGIGDNSAVDTPEVRAALYRRLDDADEDTSYEAVKGLARLRDERVLPVLLGQFEEHPEDRSLRETAANFLGEPKAYDAPDLLDRLKAWAR